MPDERRHDIRTHEAALQSAALALNEVQIQKSTFEDHPGVRERVQSYKSIYEELRKDFLAFATRWL